MRIRTIGAAAASAILGYLPVMLRDAVGLAGAGSLLYGVQLVYLPAAYMLAGIMLIVVAWLLAQERG